MEVLDGNWGFGKPGRPVSNGTTSIIPSETSTDFCACTLPPISRPSEKAGSQSQRAENVVSQGGRASPECELSRVLQPHIFDTQKPDRVASDHESICTKLVLGELYILHGNCCIGPRCGRTRRLGCDNRSQGCVLAGSDAPSIQEVPQVYLRWPGFPTYNFSLRPGISSQGVYGASDSVSEACQVPGYSDPHVSGRLDHTTQEPRSAQSPLTAGAKSLSEVWDGNKLEEVSGHSDPGLPVHWDPIQAGLGLGLASGREGREVGGATGLVVGGSETVSREMEVSDRSHVVDDETDSVGQVNDQAFPVASGRQLVSSFRISERHSQTESLPGTTHTLVEEQTEYLVGCQSEDLQSFCPDIHRCELNRLGSSHRRESSRCPGDLELGTASPGYQLERTQGCGVGPPNVEESGQRSESVDSVRQFNSSGLYQQAGRHALSPSDGSDLGAVQTSPRSQLSDKSSSYPGKAQHGSRHLEQGRPVDTNRVVTASGGSRSNLEKVGQTNGRLICDQVQQETGSLCVSDAGQPGMEGGCPVGGLEGSGSICLSPRAANSQSPQEDAGGALHLNPHSAMEDRSAVVPTPPGNVDRSANAVAYQAGPSHSASFRGSVRKRGSSKTTRVEAIKFGFREEGFSDSVAEKAAKCRKVSTLNIYDSKWLVFVDWCKEKSLDPLGVTAGQVASFLEWLFEGPKQASPSTIAGYRTAISKVLKANGGVEVSNNPVITDLMSYFKLERPALSSKFPKWDLILVLRTLKKPPFKDMVNGNLKFITWKTVFLLLLAVGARRGEIHAIDSSSITQQDNYRSLRLKPNPAFMAKTHNMCQKGVLEAIVVNSLKDVSGKDPDLDYDLCPVRAVKYYMAKTEAIRKDLKPLFLTYKAGATKPAAKNTISSWVKQLIVFSYENAPKDQEMLALCSTSTHEIRALSASLALFNNVAIEDILDCCRWSNQTTFTSHYLRDCTDLNQRLHQVLPLSLPGGGD